jgi:phage terminase small subunit
MGISSNPSTPTRTTTTTKPDFGGRPTGMPLPHTRTAQNDPIVSLTTEDTLTVQQELFCHVFMDLGNASEAYTRVYNTSVTGKALSTKAYKLRHHPKIVARIRELRKIAMDAYDITPGYVIGNLIEVVDRCMQVKELADSKGVIHGFRFDPTNAISALSLLGKHLGLYTDRSEVKVSIDDPGGLLAKLQAIQEVIIEGEGTILEDSSLGAPTDAS